jgi:hypothetical protein
MLLKDGIHLRGDKRMYSFKDYIAVDYTETDDEQLALNAKKRKSGEIDEVMTPAQRMKMKAAMRKNKAKIALGRKKAARKLATADQLKGRAQKQAKNILIKKMTKDKDKSELSLTQRGEIERRLKKKKGAIDKLAKKLFRKVKEKDRQKLQNKAS